MGDRVTVRAQWNKIFRRIDHIPFTKLGNWSDMVNFYKALSDIPIDTSHLDATGKT